MRVFMTAMSKGGAVVLSMLLLFTSNSTLADLFDSYIGTENVVIQKPALNSSIIGEALTGWINSGMKKVVGGSSLGYGSYGLTISSSTSDVSYSESGKNYTVYHVALPNGSPSGIGFVLRTYSKDCYLGGGTCSSPVLHVQDTFNGYKVFRDGGFWAYDIHYEYEIKFITTSQDIEPGPYLLGGSNIGWGNFGTLGKEDVATVRLNAFQLEYKQSGCTASLSPAVINMGVVSPLLFTGVGSTVASNAPVTVSLQCSTPDIGVLVTMTDQNNSSNSTNKLQLTPGTASATGVGVQFLKDGGSPVIYGPDSSFVDSSSAAQWRVKDKATLSNTAQFVLTPQYIQTASSITAGEANAVASITFAYD